jgi:hypothetical protein
MNTCLKGGATPAQISSFFTSLLMRNFTHEEFDGIIKGINFPIQKFQNIDIDFYIYSYLQENFSLAISLILSELNYFIYGKFKNLYLDNSNITDALKESKSNQNEENLLNQHNIHLSLSDYNKTLKNILFLSSELGFDALLNLLQISINPVHSKHKIIIMDQEGFLKLKTIASFLNLFKDSIFVITSENTIELIKMTNYKLDIKKVLHFDNLESYDSCQFTQAIRDEKYLKFLSNIIHEIFDLLKIDCKNPEKTELSSRNKFCKNIINKYLKIFEIMNPADNS